MIDSPAACGDGIVSPRTIERWIGRALGVRRPLESMLCLSLAVPPAPAERLLLLRGFRHRLLWSPSPDEEQSGVGAARTLTASGDARFVSIREGAERLFRDLGMIALDGSPAPLPRLVGGFAFHPRLPQSPLWREFGAARFVLPRLSYIRRGERAWLTLAVGARELEDTTGRIRLAVEACRALELLGSDTPEGSSELGVSLRPRSDAAHRGVRQCLDDVG